MKKGKSNGLSNYYSVIVKFYRLRWNCSVSSNYSHRYSQNPGKEKVMEDITENKNCLGLGLEQNND
jgi:hypothetical protein